MQDVPRVCAALLCLILPFALIGGIMAVLIYYNEFQHHFPPRQAAWESVKMGLVTLAVFVALALVFGGAVFVILR